MRRKGSKARQKKTPGSEDQKKANTQADQTEIERLTKWVEATATASTNMQEEWERDWNAHTLKGDATLAKAIEVVDCTNESCIIRARRAMMMPNGMCWRCTELMA